MVRKLALAVAIALGGASTSALALGLGDIRPNSVLNQPLNADIQLLSVGARELEGVKVRLAAAAAFERAGVNRAYFLSQLRFSPQRLPDGRYVVRVSTDFPMREPFLNFLVEVNWPKGRLVREYTVLLDLPTTTGRRAAQVQKAETAAPPAPQAAASQTAANQPAVAKPAGQYGPVRSNETLWGIANRVKPSGVTVTQMMMGLLQANPGAFINNDVNRLRRGQILRLPDRAEIDRISRAEASAMWQSQKEAWLARQSGASAVQASVSEPAAVAPEDLPVAETRSVPAAAADKSETDSRLRIAAPRPDGEGEAGAGETENAKARQLENLNNQLLIARENAESARIEAGQLRQRVDQLQAQMEDMQRLLTLKDDQLAQLQQRVVNESKTAEPVPQDDVFDTAQAAREAAEQTAPEVGASDDLTTAPGEEIAIGDEGTTVPEGTDAAVEPTIPGAASSDPDEIVVGGAEPEIEAVSGTTEPSTVTEPAAEPAVPAQPAETVADETAGGSTASDLLSDIREKLSRAGSVPIVAAAIAALVFLASAFGFLLSRRRRKVAEAKFDREYDGLADAFDERPTDDVVDVGDAASGPDTSMLSEFVGNDAALQDDTADVDPLSEADVYIAYGRYQQAEQLLRHAMDKDPERLALPHKLLEVFYATRKPAAFVGLAGEMMADGRDKKDGAAWERVKEMGRELAPDNPVFTAVAGGATVTSLSAVQAKASDAPVDDSIDLGDLGLSEYAAERSTTAVDTDTSDMDLTLDLDGLTRELEQEEVDGDSVDLDEIDTLELELSEAVSDPQEEEIIPLELPDTGVSELRQERIADVDDVFDPSELQSELEELSEIVSLDLDMAEAGDLSDLEPPTALRDALASVDQELTGEGLLLDSDDQSAIFGEEEVDTKLELARAYVDMGDKEGARSILEEVQEEGSDSQKGQAEELLQRLGT